MEQHRRESDRPLVDAAFDRALQPIVWLTPKQASARAQVGARVIYSEVRAGRLRAARVGGRRELRIRPEWIDAWLEQCANPIETKDRP